MVPGWTAMMARVPASASPTVRVCGKGRRVPPSGLPQYCRFSGVSGTSIITPSRAMTRQWRIHAPGVPGFATGTATRSNSTFIGSAPSLFRAWDNALVVGTFHSPLQTRAKRRPLTSLRITSSYPSVNNANARTKYTTTCAGSVRDLFSRDCVSVRTSSTMNLGTVRVRVPSVTWSVSFPGFPVSIPLIIIEWLVIDGGIDVSTRRTIFSEYTQWESWNRRSCLVAVRTGTSSADQSGTEEGSARGRYRVAMVLRRSVGTCASTGLTTRHWLHPWPAHSYADDLSQDVSNSPDQQFPVDRDGAVHNGDHCSQLTNLSLQPAHQFRGAPVHLVGAPFDIGEHVDDPGQVLEGNHGGRPKVIDPDMATSSPVLCVTRAHPSPRSHRS